MNQGSDPHVYRFDTIFYLFFSADMLSVGFTDKSTVSVPLALIEVF